MSWKLLHENIDALSIFGGTLSKRTNNQSDFVNFVKFSHWEKLNETAKDKQEIRNAEMEKTYDGC